MRSSSALLHFLRAMQNEKRSNFGNIKELIYAGGRNKKKRSQKKTQALLERTRPEKISNFDNISAVKGEAWESERPACVPLFFLEKF